MTSETLWGILDGLRIALVILHADPALGGAERYTVDLASALARRGHDVSLVFSASIPQQSVVLYQPDLPYRLVKLQSGGLTRLGQYEAFLRSLDHHLAAEPYDIVHAMLPVRQCDVYHPHAGLAAESIEAGHLRYANPLRRWLSRLGTTLNRKRQRFAAVERELIDGPHPPVVLCLSERMRQAALKFFTVDAQRVVRLFNGVDLNRFDPTQRPEARTEVRQRLGIGQRVMALSVAQDFQRKGVREAIEALAAVQDQRLVLVVVGRDRPDPFRRLAHSLGVDQQVIFTGPSDNVYAYYQAADFLLFPSRVDPCPLVVLEAVAMGLPVIVTQQAGSSEAITNGQEGFIISSPSDTPQMAQAARILMDESRRRQMRDACMRLRQELSHQSHVDKLLEVYSRIRPA